MTLPAPSSPCINVCVLDAGSVLPGVSAARSTRSRGWGRMSAAEQWAVMDAARAGELASGARPVGRVLMRGVQISMR